jgi:tetratricopeptide (TPR) repeat protein
MFGWFQRLFFYKADKFVSGATDAYRQYNASYQLPDLEKTVECYRHALSKSDKRHDRYTFILINLAVMLIELNKHRNPVGVDADRYREPIDLLTKARNSIESKPAADRPANYFTALFNLGWLYLDRYREKRTESDLRASIEAFECVRSSTPSGSQRHCSALIEHAAALWTDCEVRPEADSPSRLEQALTYLNEARRGNHPDLEGDCYKHLAAVHDLLYREASTKNLKKAMAHLNSAIDFNQSSVGLLQDRSGDPALSLNLARQLFARYTASTEKKEDDLKDAEMNCQEAKSLAEQERGSDPELLSKINKLANNIQQYKKTATFRRGSADQY